MSEKITCDFCGFEANKKDSLKVNLGPGEDKKDIEFYICSKECARARELDMKLFFYDEQLTELNGNIKTLISKQ